MGAIDESGWSYVADYAAAAGADAAYLEREKRRQLELLAQRRRLYTPWRERFDPAGRVAIVVDDGLATGATMIAALHGVRSRKPRLLVCAVPVASREALMKVAAFADDVVCLEAPARFSAVAQVYGQFDQVPDEDVARILRKASLAHVRRITA